MSKNENALQNFKDAIFSFEPAPENTLADLINDLSPKDALEIAFRHFAIGLQLYERQQDTEVWIRAWFALAQRLDPNEYKTDHLGTFYNHYDKFLDNAIMQCGSQLEMALLAYFDGDALFCRAAVTRVLASVMNIRLGYRWSIISPASWNLQISSATENITFDESAAIRDYRFSAATKEYLQNIWLSIYYDIEDVLLDCTVNLPGEQQRQNSSRSGSR